MSQARVWKDARHVTNVFSTTFCVHARPGVVVREAESWNTYRDRLHIVKA